MKVLIIDDESHARENLSRRLLKIDPDINIVDTASNVMDAFSKINTYNPDLIFLDIEMPGGDGFSLLEKFENINFDVIFVTAYAHFALKAFEQMAVGYITKPIDNDLLTKVYQRSKENINSQKYSLDKELLDSISNRINSLSSEKIALPTVKGLDLIESQSIIMLRSSDGYTNIYLKNGEILLSSKRLKYFEERLDDSFLRMHKSTIININSIKRYHKTGFVTLSDGQDLPVGRKYKKEIEKIIRT